ncbi:hypothetical protein KRZ98_17890 [Sphingobium sp. AS12]|uniref:hypothetical protein n=1 Tax=Sphingobium sp. AS12 TaxID=2849495 RepID=UPI001C3163A4|nr:hypothetical protein [Sphingobium sp. AS12]MBV2150118.1 hypothetical protein [Sphingobium sp. AS12]
MRSMIGKWSELVSSEASIGRADVFSVQNGAEKLVAVYQATLSAVETRPPV